MKIFFSILVLIIVIFFYIFSLNKTTPQQNSTQILLETIEDYDNYPIRSIEQTIILEDTPQSIPEEQTFDTIKKIIQDINQGVAITLNSKMNSLIYTIEGKEKFKNEISTTFNISYDEVDKNYDKNKLVWDWVNQYN